MKGNLFKCDVCDFGVVMDNWVGEHMRIKHNDNGLAMGAYGHAGARHMSWYDSQLDWSGF